VVTVHPSGPLPQPEWWEEERVGSTSSAAQQGDSETLCAGGVLKSRPNIDSGAGLRLLSVSEALKTLSWKELGISDYEIHSEQIFSVEPPAGLALEKTSLGPSLQGTLVHKAIECQCRDMDPPSMTHELKMLLSNKGLEESLQEAAIHAAVQCSLQLFQCSYFQGLLHKDGNEIYLEKGVSWIFGDCLIRGKIDLFLQHLPSQVGHVFDFKTGQAKLGEAPEKDHLVQLALYAKILRASKLNLKQIRTSLLYVDSGLAKHVTFQF
jgi:hypothetical protein